MPRFASRSPVPAVQYSGSVTDSCSDHEQTVPATPMIHASWAALLAFAGLLALPGLSSAQSDNVLLDFTATWCGPCQQMSSIVSRLERQGLPIRKVDVDQEPQLAARFGVKSIPCFVLIADGKELDRVNGLTTEQQLRGMLNRLPKSAPIAKEAEGDRRDGPDLGQAIPVTPSPREQTPPRSLPAEFGPGSPGAPAGHTAPAIRFQSPEGNPLRSSVRIRVKDGNAINYGSGTIIESQPGQAILVSCAHIFRKLSKSAVIEVDVYTNPKSAKPDMIPGTVLLTDMEADVSLVRINYPNRLPSIRLSSLPLTKDEPLFSIGCGGGDNPSREDVKLTGINKYDGPDNLECSGRPQKGRSGGGLFREDELVGVCIAAHPKQAVGIYAGLLPIIELLEKSGLGHLSPRTPRSSPSAPADHPFADTLPNEKPAAPDTGIGKFASTDDDISKLLERELNFGPEAGADEFSGAEVICIVRSRTPGKPSRVVIVNQASERFVADLLHESGGPGESRLADRNSPLTESRGSIETSFETLPYRRVRP